MTRPGATGHHPSEGGGGEAFKRIEQIGDCTLYLGDCLALLPTLDRGCSVVSDPPYGMDWNTDSTRFTGGEHKRGDGRADWGDIEGDAEPFDPAPWLEFRTTALWGANHYAQRLPVGRTLVWLKKPPALFGTFLSDCEIGWASGGHGVFAHFRQFPPPSRMAENDGATVGHPTQKPISLMEWCISEFARGEHPVIDPYMGSGTTGVAAVRLQRAFIGIERTERHFDTACRRISEAYRQPRLFAEPPPKPVQPSIFPGDAA